MNKFFKAIVEFFKGFEVTAPARSSFPITRPVTPCEGNTTCPTKKAVKVPVKSVTTARKVVKRTKTTKKA